MTLRSKVANFKAAAGFGFWKAAGGRLRKPERIVYIQDSGDWVLARVGSHLREGARAAGLRFVIGGRPDFLRNDLVHFGSLGTFEGGWERIDSSNRVIVTAYHGDPSLDPAFARSLDRLVKASPELAMIVTSTTIMHTRLRGWGVPSEKIRIIPIGVELGAFPPSDPAARAALRRELSIADDAVCIGSFQKDGNGWGEGLEPKLIKGPDLFIEAIARLARERKVHCLLTGPSRGYVKKRLEELGVPYSHRMLKGFSDVARMYACLDLYLVTSREEGGPMAIMESMAAGVPLVSTRMGMAPDIIRHGENGMLADVGDVDGIVRAAENLLDDHALRQRCLAQAGLDVKRLDWGPVSAAYAALYRESLA